MFPINYLCLEFCTTRFSANGAETEQDTDHETTSTKPPKRINGTFSLLLVSMDDTYAVLCHADVLR